MFIHNLKYTFKTLFRSKTLIFWTFAFPIILGTLFNLAFSNLENSEKLSIIDIAIVNNEEYENSQIIKETFKVLSDENNKDRLFNTQYVNLEKAENLLKNNEISGYLIVENDMPKVVITTNGINQTILKYVTEEIVQNSEMVTNIANKEITEQISTGNKVINYEQIYENIIEKIEKNDVQFENISNKNLSYTMIEFYTLIAMTCLYGGTLAMVSINNSLANMGNIGKRVAVTPINKGKIILSSIIASYITQIIGLVLLFLYTIFVLKVDYGNNLFYIILLALVGSLAGLSLGIAVATLIKSSDNTKVGILISLTMLGCFLSGMMGITMKYVIDKNVAIVNKLNPASMITDGFYSLYYYNTYDRYFFNIISLLIFSSIMIVLSYRGLRRQRYDSI